MHRFMYDAYELRAFRYCVAHGIPAVLPLRKASVADIRFACLVFDREASVLRGIKLEPLPLRVNNNISTTTIITKPHLIYIITEPGYGNGHENEKQEKVKKLSFRLHDIYSMASAAYTFDMNPMFSATG